MAFDNERSSLWGMAAGGAIAGGIGVGAWKNRAAFSQAWSRGVSPVSSSLPTNIGGFRTGAAGVESGMATEAMQAMSSTFANKSGLGTALTDIHGAAYRSIMSGGVTSHEEAIEALSAIGKQATGGDAYKAAMSAIGAKGGSASVFEASLTSFATGADRAAMSGVSGGGFGSTFASTTRFSDLSSAAQARAIDIEKNIGRAAGDKFNVQWSYKTVEDLIDNKRVKTPMLIGRIGEGRIASIPLADTGLTYDGDTLSTRYITRKGYRAGGTQMSYPELYERNIAEALSASQSNAQMKQQVLNAHQNLIEQMNVRDSNHRAAAVWTGPFTTSGGAAKARLTRAEAVAFGETDPLDVIGRQNKLYPWTSAGAAGKETLTTRNLATELYGDIGGLMSAEEIPTQFVRGEWGVTTEAKGRARGFGGTFGKQYSRLGRKGATAGYKELIYGGESAFSGRAYSAPQLMTFYAKPAGGKIGGLGYADPQLNRMLSAEEGVISSRVGNMMEYERVVQKKITLDKGMRTNKALLGKFKTGAVGKGPMTLEGEIASGFMGIERGTGAEISGEIIGAELTGKDAATLYMRERKQMSENEMWKFFSEENKFTAAAANEAKMKQVLSAAGAEATIAGQEVEAMFSGKLVAKRPAALITQQTEAAAMFLSHKIDRGMPVTPEMTAYLNDPAAALNVKGIMASNKTDAHIQIQKNLIGMAKGWGFKKEELARTFGLASEAALEGSALTMRERVAVRESAGVIGLGKGRLGDIMSEGGAGSWGTFEQTGFRALGMKGEAGQRYAVEMSKRISGGGELAAADTMMSTILGQESMVAKFKRGDLPSLASMSAEDVFQAEGRYVSLGQKIKAHGGSKTLYIPGTAEAPGMMRDIISGSGKRVRSPLAQEIMGLRSALRSGGTEAIELAAESLRGIALQTAEAQASARGKIIGSQMLAGQRRDFGVDPDAFRISGETGESMFSDLLSRAQSEEQTKFLAQQREAFRKGEVMTGGMWRHPTSGPESFQWAKFKKDATVANGMVAAPTQFGKIQFQGKEIPIDVSAMVGFKGDYDNDKFVLSVISDRRTADMARRAADNEGRQAYSQYLFNHYTMKDKMEGKISKSGQVLFGSDEALRQGYKKLSTAKTATGQVNIALQKLKIGMMETAGDQYRPIAEMFFHLEEAAIGGKHGVLSSDLYQAIAQSVETGGEKGIGQMEGVIKAVMGDDPRIISGEITDAFGTVRKHTLDYNPRKWAETSISAYDVVSSDVDVAMRAVRASRGKNLSAIDFNRAVEMTYARQTGSVDFAQQVMRNNMTGGADDFTTKGTKMIRKGQVKARGMLSAINRAKKPMLAGLGIAAGVMLMAPSTAGVLRNPEGANGGRGMMPDDYGAPSGPSASPNNPDWKINYQMPPQMNASSRIYDIGSGSKTSHANIRMRVNDLNSSSRDFMASARQLSDGGNVNIRTRDDRSALDPRMLANKIHERL